MRVFLPLAALLLLACSGDFWRGCTARVVGKTVETTKEVTTGVAEGIAEGRKQGQSVDGARVVSAMAELEGLGSASLHEVTGVAVGTDVVIALANDSDQPLRFTDLKVQALDADGFVLEPDREPQRQVTVPPRAKERLVIHFNVTPDRLGEVRLYDTPLARP